MNPFHLVVGSILAANVFWWWWADKRLRPLPRARVWRVALALFMAWMVGYLGTYIVAPGWARQAHTVLPEPVIALSFLWHLICLPVGVVIALVSALCSLPGRLRGGNEGEPVTRRRFLGAMRGALISRSCVFSGTAPSGKETGPSLRLKSFALTPIGLVVVS